MSSCLIGTRARSLLSNCNTGQPSHDQNLVDLQRLPELVPMRQELISERLE